jgi:CDP-2,3-bis-(O-geranylgeranyl)-sn-glycerol synthase
MEIVTLLIAAMSFIFPAYCANGAPVLGGGGKPMDFGKNFVDGKRVFGANKTFRGFFFGLGIGVAVGFVDWIFFANTLGYPWAFAIFIPFGGLVGDLMGAFLKRRLNIAPGELLPVIDQIDFVLGALLFSLPLMIIGWEVAITVLLITPPIHLVTNFCAYKLKLKKHPW